MSKYNVVTYKSIVVAYWREHHDDKMGIKQNEVFEYSNSKLHEIIEKAISNNLNVMTIRGTWKGKPRIIIYIDSGRFRQM
jgi:hypothetical protein